MCRCPLGYGTRTGNQRVEQGFVDLEADAPLGGGTKLQDRIDLAAAQAYLAQSLGDGKRLIEMSHKALALLPADNLATRGLVAMNQKSYDNLNPKAKAVVDKVSGQYLVTWLSRENGAWRLIDSLSLGAGVVVLEELEHAKARGAKIYAELIGYGMSGDAFHITAPTSDGDGAFRCMSAAIRRAGIQPGDIDYINAHGTSTPLGDEIELGAVTRLMGNAAGQLSMSSTKSSIGHLLGAAGAVEAIFSILAIRDQIAPPTLNLVNPSVDSSVDLVPLQARPRKIDTVLSNSFGFGGTNASIILRRAH